MHELSVTIPVEPVPWTVWPRRGPPPSGFKRMQQAQQIIQACLRSAWGNRPPLEGPVGLDVLSFRTLPKSAPKNPEKRRAWEAKHIITRPDATNSLKMAEDACQGVLFLDDAQVVDGRRGKWFAPPGQPGYIVIRVWEIVT